MTKSDFYQQAFSRNIGIVTEQEQEKIRQTTVAIIGMGGGGGIIMATLLRTGFERFKIADFDTFEVVNFNRQYGAFTHTIGKNKAEAMAEIAKTINPDVNLTVVTEAVDENNVTTFLADADLVVDALDYFVPEARYCVYKQARKNGICVWCWPYWIWRCYGKYFAKKNVF